MSGSMMVDESTILMMAVFVFVMMIIGLGLTVWEFRYGQPRREEEEAARAGSDQSARGRVVRPAAAPR